MLKVFVSTTFRDLEKERGQLIERLDKALEAAAMETFTPHGDTPQEAAINELQESDVVVFLISSYGRLLDTCVITDCKATCSMKFKRKGKISYTHCEYMYARAEGKLHKMYRIEQPLLEDTDEKIKRKFKKFIREVEKEFYRKIVRKPEDIQIITEHLSSTILKWYLEKRIRLRDFCGRKKKLKELLEKMEKGSVEVYGMGGIGKTTLVHVALLLQILKGKKVVSLTRELYYTTGSEEIHCKTTGSGYIHFKKKVQEHEVGERITLDDVMDALKVPEDLRIEKDDKIDYILKKIKNEDIILFIDDFQLADENVTELVKRTQNVVISSRKKMGYALYDVHVRGIEEIDEFIDLVSGGAVSGEAKKKIKEAAEGHPVSTIILVKNYQRIDFTALENFKNGLDVSKEEHAGKFLRQIIEEILSEEALKMLEVLAALNPRLKSNIDVDSLERVYRTPEFYEIFNELVDTGMLEKWGDGVYTFCFDYVRDSLADYDKWKHWIVMRYYGEKYHEYKNEEDSVECLHHWIKMECVPELVDEFVDLCKKIEPTQKGPFRRLVEAGEKLRNCLEEEEKGNVLEELALLYYDLKRFAETERAYLDVLEIYEKLAEEDPFFYSLDLAMSQYTLGLFYYDLKRFGDAEKAYVKALEIHKKSAEEHPHIYLPCLAMAQNSLGNLYYDLKRFADAGKVYTEALKIYEKFAEEDPDAYLPKLAETQNNLGDLYDNVRRFDEAEKVYTKALEIRKKLAEEDPDAYLPDLATTQNNLGNTYRDLKRFDDAEKAYKKALEIFKVLAEEDPDAYLPHLATAQNNLGILYCDLKRFDEAEKAHSKALEIRKKLAEEDPDAYLLDLAGTQNNLGAFYSDLKRFDEAEKAYKKALEIFKVLAEEDPDAYLPHLAMVQNNLGSLYSSLKRFNEAEKVYKKVLKIHEKLAEENLDIYSLDLFKIQADIGVLYIRTNRTEEGVNILKNILENTNLPPDFRAVYHANLGKGYEILENEKAAWCYFLASANYFILYNRGVHCLDDVIHYLTKVTKLGDKELKKDASLMKIALNRLLNPQKEIKIPEVNYSKRGKPIIEAFKGKEYKFEPENEIDIMSLTLARDIRVLSNQP